MGGGRLKASLYSPVFTPLLKSGKGRVRQGQSQAMAVGNADGDTSVRVSWIES